MKKQKDNKAMLPPGKFQALRMRGLLESTCRTYDYFTSTHNGKPVQVAQYYDAEGNPVAQKVRFPGKDFMILGDMSKATLYGQQLWRSHSKKVIVTEGEIDALSVAQALSCKWPVVSVPNGAAGAKTAIKRQLEWLESHDEVTFFFDNDDPGRKAATECAELLTPGKAKVLFTPGYKDANDMLQDGKTKELYSLTWEGKTVRPDGIVNGSETWESVNRAVESGLAYPWSGLDRIACGARGGEIVTLSGGSGIGKSAFVREIAYHFAMAHNQNIGYVALEENLGRTARGFMGLHVNRPLHLPGNNLPAKELRTAFDSTLGTGRFWLYDHFGSLDADHLLAKMRFMVKGCDAKWIVLDHISIVVSGMDIDDNERRALDNIMTHLRTFTEETGAGLFLVSHLKRPDGKGHEEGAATSLSQLRGSAAIAQLSDIVIGLERNQQADDPEDRNVTTMRVLKNRYTGETGVAEALRYDRETGRLSSVPFAIEDGDVVTAAAESPFA